MRRSHHPNGRIGARPWATRLTALLAVFLQAFVLQTHVHAAVPLVNAGYERAADDTSAATIENAAHQEAQTACALCQAQSASRALTPSAHAIAIDGGGAFIEPTAEIRAVALAPIHSWQSRAPPALL